MAKKSNEENAGLIVALLEELRGAEMHGDDAQVADIKASLARVGYQAEKPSKRAEQRPAVAKAETR
jgi:hypothetical protein